jgi:hypothetical protein
VVSARPYRKSCRQLKHKLAQGHYSSDHSRGGWSLTHLTLLLWVLEVGSHQLFSCHLVKPQTNMPFEMTCFILVTAFFFLLFFPTCFFLACRRLIHTVTTHHRLIRTFNKEDTRTARKDTISQRMSKILPITHLEAFLFFTTCIDTFPTL